MKGLMCILVVCRCVQPLTRKLKVTLPAKKGVRVEVTEREYDLIDEKRAAVDVETAEVLS